MAKKQDALGFQDQKKKGPVECLGMKFDNDEARREHFLNILREKLQDPEFRKIEGFPIGEDEDILALSDPPYYTACPNPFIEEFIKCYGRPYDPENDEYHREPFSTDVSEGKNDPTYSAHSYHTKVPHKAIMRYILHYTEPGDVVFDGFCGTGMTGVAAQMCGDRTTVESLGYQVKRDTTVQDEQGNPFSRMGGRRTLLNDLSPAATFIAHNYNTAIDVREFERQAQLIVDEVEEECGWMYLTLHEPTEEIMAYAVQALKRKPHEWRDDPKLTPYWGRINYIVWSDVFHCPQCKGQVVLWDAAVQRDAATVLDEFNCPQCNSLVATDPSKRSGASRLDRATSTVWDPMLGKTVKQALQLPVMVDYYVGSRHHQTQPSRFDMALMDAVMALPVPSGVPISELPAGYNLNQPIESHGFTHTHHFYTVRNLRVLAAFRTRSKDHLLYVLTSFMDNHANKRNRYLLDRNHTQGTTGGPLSNTLYIPPLSCEVDIVAKWRKTSAKVRKALIRPRTSGSIISTSSTTHTQLQPSTVDYVFTDPPFGGNIMYSDVNFLWESWLSVRTCIAPEAIQNDVQGKSLLDYQRLMTSCFMVYHAALRPGRWMTVVFHNSKNAVWRSIQEALQNAGFVVADVRVLDKKHTTIYQDHSPGAVKQDLVISAYKPSGELESRFQLEAGTATGVWDFVRTHLRQLPIFVEKSSQSEVIAERQDYLLFDRMVAFHVQRGVTVPLSAAEFYGGLRNRFSERDGMFFLPEQAEEYERKRMTVREVLQLQLFVTDESSAIQWLRQQLTRKPQTFQELQPQFMQEVKGWQRYEKTLELAEMLAENFLRYEGDSDVPSPVHAYLSSNYHELRSLPNDHPDLIAKARNRWYVPDPNREGDLEKIRLRALMREFEGYQAAKGKLKVVRTEALRAGFKQCWQDGNYNTIVDLAKRLPSAIIEEDSALLMYYDNALLRTEG